MLLLALTVVFMFCIGTIVATIDCIYFGLQKFAVHAKIVAVFNRRTIQYMYLMAGRRRRNIFFKRGEATLIIKGEHSGRKSIPTYSVKNIFYL